MAQHPTDLESLQRDCTATHIRDGGPGGQHRNKSFTGIRLTHEPTGVVVMATERRSQAQNIALAFTRMAEKLNHMQRIPKTRRPTKPTRGSRVRRLDSKRRHGQKKASRKVRGDD